MTKSPCLGFCRNAVSLVDEFGTVFCESMGNPLWGNLRVTQGISEKYGFKKLVVEYNKPLFDDNLVILCEDKETGTSKYLYWMDSRTRSPSYWCDFFAQSARQEFQRLKKCDLKKC